MSLNVASGNTDVGSLELINGDVNGDNRIGLADLGLLLANWDGGDLMSDLDGSGTVGLGDVGIVLLNFGRQGDS